MNSNRLGSFKVPRLCLGLVSCDLCQNVETGHSQVNQSGGNKAAAETSGEGGVKGEGATKKENSYKYTPTAEACGALPTTT